MTTNKISSLVAFFVLTYIFTLPTYILVARNPLEKAVAFIPLAALAPIVAALILSFKESGWPGAKSLLGRSFDLVFEERLFLFIKAHFKVSCVPTCRNNQSTFSSV